MISTSHKFILATIPVIVMIIAAMAAKQRWLLRLNHFVYKATLISTFVAAGVLFSRPILIEKLLVRTGSHAEAVLMSLLCLALWALTYHLSQRAEVES
jgi:hypothetical protein